MIDSVPVTPLYDLRVYDRDPMDIYKDALIDLTVKVPEWTPREGSMEVLLLQALALEVAELAFVINRLPSGMLEILLRMLGLTRDAGARPTVDLRFNFINTFGYTVPSGTLVSLDMGTGLPPVLFTTDVDLTIPVDDNTGVVPATATKPTADANGAEATTPVQLLDQIVYVTTVTLETDVTGGLDPERGKAFLERGVNRLSRLSDTLVLPQHFTAFALEQPYVYRATTLDNYDPTTDIDDDGPVGDDEGHVTVAAYGFGEELSTDLLLELAGSMEALSLGNLIIHTISPTMNEQDVDVEVKKISTYDTAVVSANVVTAIEEFLSTDAWGWGTTLYVNDLIVKIGNAEGVQNVIVLNTPAADVVLDGVAPLISTGTITVGIV